MTFFFPRKTGQTDPLERLLLEAREGVKVSHDIQKELKQRIINRIHAPKAIWDALEEATPADAVRERLKVNVLGRIVPEGVGVWDRLRASLTPPSHMQSWLRGKLLDRLEPQPAYAFMPRLLRWSVAAALVLMAVRASPLLFVAAPSRADSSVFLVPTQGDVSVLLGGLWQPVTEELTLHGSVQIRTGKDGYASLLVHDDGVVRLGPGTTFAVHDIADRPVPLSDNATFSLQQGTLWAQGLIPGAVGQGWRLAFGAGNLLLNEGSVSVTRTEKRVDIQVWDRLAHVQDIGRAEDAVLMAGEGVRVIGSQLSGVRKLTDNDESEQWVVQNLQRDAVHRREIALLQQQRRAEVAGILPTSPIYPVKRVAEAVDMLFTFGEEARTQKRLDLASTRLNEAAALLTTGTGAGAEAAAQRSLDEYRQTLLAVASGSGQDVQSLVQQQVMSEVADVSAALPDDESYALKKMVLETSAEIPGSVVKPEDVQKTMVVDTLASLTQRAQEGDILGAVDGFKEILPSLQNAQRPTSDRTVRKETEVALALFADAVREQGGKSETGATIALELSPYLPQEVAPAPVVKTLTDEEVQAIVRQMYDRIYSYKMARSRYNQLLVEFHNIEGNPDRGRILRELYHFLPENGLAQYVRTEFQRVRENVQGQ